MRNHLRRPLWKRALYAALIAYGVLTVLGFAAGYFNWFPDVMARANAQAVACGDVGGKRIVEMLR